MTTENIQNLTLRLPELRTLTDRSDFSNRAPGELSCTKTGLFESRYDLRTGSRSVAELELRGFFSPAARVRCGGGNWVFEPEGSTIVVRSEDQMHDLATVDLGFSDHGGILRLRGGRTFIFTWDAWKGRAELQLPSGEPVIRYRFRGLLRPRGDIETLGPVSRIPELPWVAALGWFIIVGYL